MSWQMFPYFLFFGKIGISIQLCFLMFLQTHLVLWRGRGRTFNDWFHFFRGEGWTPVSVSSWDSLMSRIYLRHWPFPYFHISWHNAIFFFIFIISAVMTPFSFLLLFVHAESFSKKYFAKCLFYWLFSKESIGVDTVPTRPHSYPQISWAPFISLPDWGRFCFQWTAPKTIF